jgi:dTMP kinase
MEDAFSQKLRGRFIVLDGPDGSGKSTQVRLLSAALVAKGVSCVAVRDPGGTAIGDKIRQILLDRSHDEMSVQCELMLYMASRAQLVSQIIRPAIEDGQCVLSDRYVSSTIAYQGAGGIPPAEVKAVADVAVGGLWPDLTIVLDLPPEVGFERISARSGALGPEFDRMEMKALEFHHKVRRLFLDQAAQSSDAFRVISAVGDVQQVHHRVMDALELWRPTANK